MVTVTIIDVDLGDSIADIIADDLTHITNQNKQAIDAAIAESKQVSDLKKSKDEQDQAISDAVAAAVTMLLESDERGETTGAKELLLTVTPHITNMLSLVPRMKSVLKGKGITKKLQNMRHKGQVYYYLQDESEDNTKAESGPQNQPDTTSS